MQFNTSKRAIISWCIYDWANSAFPVIVTTFIFAAYFTRKIASNEIIGTHQWGNAIALAGLGITLLSPIFGAIADYSGKRKQWLGFFTFIVILSSALLWYAYPSINYINTTLATVILGTLGLEIGMVFYNSMLPSLAPPNYLGRISGWSWSLGYLGGLVALIIALFGFVKGEPHWLNTTTAEQIRICGPFIALWFAVFSIPLFLFVPNYGINNYKLKQSISYGLHDLMKTIKTLPQQKNIFLYLIAHMIYIDGLNTIFAFGGIYAAGTFGMSMSDIILFGIVMNIAAGVGAAIMAWMDDLIGSKPTILCSLIALIFLSINIVLVHTKFWFWILGTCLCLFVGPVQSASRTLMARLIEKDNATEMFGLYAFSGKVTTFMGPWILGMATLSFNSQRVGMATVILFFILGGTLLWFVREPKKDQTYTKSFSKISSALANTDETNLHLAQPQSNP